MAAGSSKRSGVFYGVVLAIGFIVGGFLTELSVRFLPPGAVKEFLTTGVRPSLGPMVVDLVVITFAVGPIAVDVSLLALVGVLVAYLVARSLF